MKVLADIFGNYGYKAKKHEGEFGMEIETETGSHNAYPVGFLVGDGADDKGVAKYKTPSLPKWKAVADGSLRNFGMEFIFKEPYKYKEAIDAIDIFGAATKGVKFIKDAPATSVHVHTNMWNETMLTFGNYCTLHTMFENTLVEFSGEMRRSNLFSLPTRCSNTTGWNIMRMFEGIEKGDWKAVRFSDEEVKYAAFNLASLTRLGSVENRMMRGTTDPKELKTWITILYRLLQFSRIDGLTPRSIVTEYRHKGVDFFDEVFQDESADLRKACGGNLEALIDKNLYFSGLIATSVKDWNTLGNNMAAKEDAWVKVAAKKLKKLNVENAEELLAGAGGAVHAMANAGPNDFWAQPQQPVHPAPHHLPAGWIVQDEAADIDEEAF